MQTDYFINEILKLARKAAARGEVPVGALIVNPKGEIIGRGSNKAHASRDGLQHAEMIAIRQAEKSLGDWRLEGCALYVTLEPCLMCLGAIGNTRIREVYYLLADPLFGSIESKLSRAQVKKMYPALVAKKLPGGAAVQQLMGEFFTGLRQRDKRVRMDTNQ